MPTETKDGEILPGKHHPKFSDLNSHNQFLQNRVGITLAVIGLTITGVANVSSIFSNLPCAGEITHWPIGTSIALLTYALVIAVGALVSERELSRLIVERFNSRDLDSQEYMSEDLQKCLVNDVKRKQFRLFISHNLIGISLSGLSGYGISFALAAKIGISCRSFEFDAGFIINYLCKITNILLNTNIYFNENAHVSVNSVSILAFTTSAIMVMLSYRSLALSFRKIAYRRVSKRGS